MRVSRLSVSRSCFAGVDGLGDQRFQIGGERDAGAVGARAAEVGQAVDLGGMEAVDGLGQHQRQRVLARPARPGQDQRLRKALGANALAQMRDRRRIAEKILKAHGLSLVHWRAEINRLRP